MYPENRIVFYSLIYTRVGVGIMSQLSIVALFLEMDYFRMLKIVPDIKKVM